MVAGMATGRRVLVVEDEPTIAASVAARLRAEGFTVDVAQDGPSAVARASADPPDVVVLDVMLPGFDGLEVCRRLHARRPVPVLMLTARDAETDVLVGLGVGADDYMTKPFSVRELVARVHALLRRVERARSVDQQRIVLGELSIDPAERRVTRAGGPVHLTPIEFDLLRTLVRHRGRLMTHRALLVEVWGPQYADDTQVLRAHIANLRRKIEPEGERRYIRTDPGIGYRFAG
jgi:DNA-binding response OmpR family regulator